MTPNPNPPQLYIPAKYVAFPLGKAAEFHAAVTRQVESSAVAAVDRDKDLVLGPDGSLPGGFRYTATGLRQVCDILCRGLFGLVTDLTGGAGSQGPIAAEYSFPDALRTYNAVVSRRATARIVDRGVRLLRDSRDKLVEGVLGPAYVRIDNAKILEMADNAVENVATFHSASLFGRRMSLRYAAKQPLFSLDPSGPIQARETYRLGFHFANSEVGSECAIRASVLLIRDLDGSAAVGKPLGGGRVVHAGRQLSAKLVRLFGEVDGVVDRAVPAWYTKHMRAMAAKNLELPSSGEELRARLAKIASALRAHETTRTVAEAAVARAAHGGSYLAGADIHVRAARDALTRRTAWDLYNALTAIATSYVGAPRDRIERVAWNLFLGKVDF